MTNKPIKINHELVQTNHFHLFLYLDFSICQLPAFGILVYKNMSLSSQTVLLKSAYATNGRGIHYHTGEAVVQWSRVRICELYRFPGSNSRYSLTTFHSLVLPPSGQRLPKLLPYCPQTGLTMLYAFEVVAAISLAHSQHIHERK